MSAEDDVAMVVALACLTEDRTNQEQLALLRVARKADNEANKNVVGNHRMWGIYAGSTRATRQLPESRLEELVDKSRAVSDFPGDKQRPVALPKQKGRGR